ncbi:transposase, MuDR, MULE transposase domain protein [Tanacetum coccineum]
MRPLLITDGAHLKGTYKGTNLVLVGMDGNNQIIPIATGEVPNLAIIIDRHLKIILACNTVFPNAFHGPESYKKLEDAGFETWSRAMCPANRYNYMTSNNAESINNLTRHVRKAPVTMLMDCRKWKLSGIPCCHVIAVGKVMGCTDCSELALGWFRKTTLYSTYQELVYPVGEPSTWQCPDGLQVVKPPNMNFRPSGKPKNTNRMKSQGEELIQVRFQGAMNLLHQTRKDLDNQCQNPKGTRDEVSNQHSYCFNVEDDPKTFDEAMKSHDVAFWKEAINDEVDSIMGNNTWVLADLPPCCKPISCKWIFKRKLKVDRTIEKFKARLVIQDFKQKSRIGLLRYLCSSSTYQYHKTVDCCGINSQSDYSSDGCEDGFLEW